MDHFKSYKQFLLENINSPYFYHGTKEVRLPNILKYGLTSGQRDDDTIYVTSDIDVAIWYSNKRDKSKTILRFKNKGGFEEAKGENEYSTEEIIKPDELEILVNNKWIKLSDYMNPEFLLEYQRQDISLLESMDDYFTIGFEIELESDFINESMKMYMSRKEQKKVSNFEKNFMNFVMKYGQDFEYHLDETLINGLEIVSIPFNSIKKAKDFIKSFFSDYENQEDWIFDHNTSIHVNIGSKNKEWNVVKGIMMLSDEFVFKDIESRKNSEYCKSLKSEIEKGIHSKILPKDNTIKSMEDSIKSFLVSSVIKNDFGRAGSNKEFGMNISKVLFDYSDYVEYRHIGDANISDKLVIDKLMYYCYITYLMTSDYKNKEYFRKLSGFIEKIKQKFIGESLDIKKLISGYSSNRDELKSIKEPMRVDDTDYVYVFRFTNKEEVDKILNGDKSGGFWSTNRDYVGDYILISKTNTQDNASFINVPSNRQEYFLSWNKDEPVHTKNPLYIGRPTMYNNNFYEVGRTRTLNEIIDIVDSMTGESIM